MKTIEMDRTQNQTRRQDKGWSLGLVVITVLTMLMLPLVMMAEPVDQESAKQKALAFLNGRHLLARDIGEIKAEDLHVSFTCNEYHIFNRGEKDGFVIVSGDDAMPDVLGYSDNGRFDTNDMPPALQDWLKGCSETAKYARENHLPKYQPAKTRGSGKNVGPLVKTKWGQSSPYNTGYPQVNGSACLTGCVPTAMAQIINYHKHPKGMTAEITGYVTYTFAIEMPTLPPTTFDWDNMLDNYNGMSTDAQKAAVSKLMMYCSTAARADLGPGETGAYSPEPTFKKYFGFGNGVRMIYRNDVVSDVWKELIFNELDEHRPILGRGASYDGESGHAYVVDGYDANGLLSVNWGWKGLDDGFYNMLLIHPGPGIYSMSEIIIGISPEDIQLEYDSEEVVLTSIIGDQPYTTYYMYGNQSNVNISAIHTSNLKGIYDIDYNWAIYQNGLFVEYLYSEKNTHTFTQVMYGNKYDETSLMLPGNDSKNLGMLFVEPGAYKLVPVSRKHGTEDWKENICTDKNCLTILSFQDQYGMTNLRIYGGEPKSTVDPAQLAVVKNTYQGLKEAAEAKLATVNQNASDIEAIKKVQQTLDELEEKVEDYGDLDLQIRGMQFGDKKTIGAEFSSRFQTLKKEIEEINLPSTYFLEDDNSTLQTNLKHYVKAAKGEMAMTQYIMNDQELKESQQRSSTLAQQIEACDITAVTQDVKTAKQTIDNLNIGELKKQVMALAVDVNIVINGGGKAGDANGDNQVDGKDIIEVVNYIMGKPSNIFRKWAVDLNVDEEVDAADLVLLINRVNKK